LPNAGRGSAAILTSLCGLATVAGLELMAYWITLGGDPGTTTTGLDSDEIGLPGILLMVLFPARAAGGHSADGHGDAADHRTCHGWQRC
jgi:hypothetical protein